MRDECTPSHSHLKCACTELGNDCMRSRLIGSLYCEVCEEGCEPYIPDFGPWYGMEEHERFS